MSLFPTLRALTVTLAAIAFAPTEVAAQRMLKHIVIVNATYDPSGSRYELDTNGDMQTDLVVSDPRNAFFETMMNEYTWRRYMTHIWINERNEIIDAEQWLL